MDGGRLRRPPLINYQFYIKQIIKIYRKTYKKCKNMQKYTKYGRGAVQISQTMGPSGPPWTGGADCSIAKADGAIDEQHWRMLLLNQTKL